MSPSRPQPVSAFRRWWRLKTSAGHCWKRPKAHFRPHLPAQPAPLEACQWIRILVRVELPTRTQTMPSNALRPVAAKVCYKAGTSGYLRMLGKRDLSGALPLGFRSFAADWLASLGGVPARLSLC